MLALDHPILAYWLDEAVGWFGMWVENKLNEQDMVTAPDGKKSYVPRHRIENLLGLPIRTRRISEKMLVF